MTVYLDGADAAHRLGTATLGASRPDVGTYFGDHRFDNSGWHFATDTSALSFGAHTFYVQAHSSVTGRTSTLSQTIQKPLPYPDDPRGNIDDPADGAVVTGTVRIDGWTFDRNAATGTGIDTVTVYLDGTNSSNLLGAATYGDSRPDVASYFGDGRLDPSGFHYDWSTTGVPAGSHTLYAQAHSSATGTTLTLTHTVTVAVATLQPRGSIAAVPASAATYTYAYDGDGLLHSRSDGTMVTTFTWDTSVAPARLLAISAGGNKESIVNGIGDLYVDRGTSVMFYARDGLGSVRAEVTDSGTTSISFAFTAFGDVAAGGGVPTLGFAAELRDPSALIFLRARWYDPVVGVFSSADAFPGASAVPASLSRYAYAAGRPTVNTDASGLWTGGLCLSANFSAGAYGTYQLCPLVVASNGEIGWTATIGAGLSPSLAVSAVAGLQGSNANRISDLTGPFNQAGASAGEGLVGGADYFWSDDMRVQGLTGSAGFGFRATGFAPVEVHVARTDTRGGAYFNIFDFFRSFLKLHNGKPPAE